MGENKWSEVNSRLDPVSFTMVTIPDRIGRIGDLWKGVLGRGFDLAEGAARLETYPAAGASGR
jgi:DNA primase